MVFLYRKIINMKELIQIGSFTPRRKRTSLENMTPRDWAEITIDFLNFCKPSLLSYKGENHHYKSSLNFGLDTEEQRFRELDSIVKGKESHNYYYQKIEWRNFTLPTGITKKTEAFGLLTTKDSRIDGIARKIVITRDAQLLICDSKFAFREKHQKTEFHYATECAIVVGNDETLAAFFEKESIIASDLLRHLFIHTKDMIRHEYERIAEEKVSEFNKAFEESVISQWTVHS